MSHTFQHNQGGSWVEFSPLSRSDSVAQSEETNSTRSSGSSACSANTALCDSSSGMDKSTIVTSTGTIVNLKLGNSDSGIDTDTTLNLKNELKSANNHIMNKTDYIHYCDTKNMTCYHQPQKDTAYMLPSGEWCIGLATTVWHLSSCSFFKLIFVVNRLILYVFIYDHCI